MGKAAGSEKLLFVAGALPGEEAEAELLSEKPTFGVGRLARLLEPSPSRVEPDCPHHFRPGAAEFCGGCDWQHAAYPLQLELKREIILDCLKRLARIEAPVAPALPSPVAWRYRNKVQVPFQPAAGNASAPRAGFYMPGTHRVVEFSDCLAQPELSVAILKSVRELAAELRWRMYDEERGRGWLRHLFVRTNSSSEAAVAFVTRTPDFPDEREAARRLLRRHPGVASLWQNVQPEKTSVILGPRWRKLSGKDRLSERIGGLTLEFSPAAFLQVNTPATEVLYRETERQLLEDGLKPSLLLDVYSGIGAIAFWLAPRAGRVVGIEESGPAFEDACANARRLGTGNVSFLRGKAQEALPGLQGIEASPLAAVLDPPRAGCERGVLEWLARRRAERVVYVSCNPATFARDARILTDGGYCLKEVQPVDLFPQTSHVELVGRFDLGATPRADA